MNRRALGAVLGATLLLAACGGQAVQPGPSAAPETREVTLVKAVRPTLVATLDALRKNDLAAARAAFASYDAAWNGIEVYVNFRSRELYAALENDFEAKIQAALDVPQPDAAQIAPLVEEMIAKYDEAIALVRNGPAISPLFDDVATIRIVRSSLRTVSPALKANDIARALSQYGTFQRGYPEALPLLKLRASEIAQEVESAKAKVAAAFAQGRPAAAATLVDALVERYNAGLALVNAAARNADLKKTAFTVEDTRQSVALGAVDAELRASLALWSAGDYAASATHANRAKGERFDAVVAALKARAADAALKTALDNYVALAGQAGDAAKVRAANKAALEAAGVAQQALVGQFWTDPKLHVAFVRGAVTMLRDEDAARPAGYQTAWGLASVAELRYAVVAPQSESVVASLRALRGAFPDAAKAPAPLPTKEAVTQLANGVDSALGR